MRLRQFKPGAPAWQKGWRRHLPDAAATGALAAYFAAAVQPPRVVAIVGEMGAGKTHFVRALAAAWGGVNMDEVASPTYSLMHIYPGHRGALVHIDLWRVADLTAAAAFGLEEAIGAPEGVVLVEWADRLPALLPADAWGVRLELADDGGRWASLVGPPPEAGEQIGDAADSGKMSPT